MALTEEQKRIIREKWLTRNISELIGFVEAILSEAESRALVIAYKRMYRFAKKMETKELSQLQASKISEEKGETS